MLVSMKSLLADATAKKYAVGYFEAFNMDCMLAVLDAAQAADSPVIIGFGGQFISSPKREVPEDIYHYGALARAAAQRASVPVAVLLNESNVEDMIYQGMQAGFNAVMYQKEGEDPAQTLRITAEICRVAHMLGIDVESEVGELPCANVTTGTQTAGTKTDIATAKHFVEATGIDALAIAVGNVHLLEGEKAPIDHELLRKLRREISVPLVLHGGTGLSAEDLKAAIANGIAKVNVGTGMKRAYIRAIQSFCQTRQLERIDPHVTVGWGGSEDMISCGRKAIAEVVSGFIDILGSRGKAQGFSGK